MKKGIVLSSLFVFILASTAGGDFLFHVSSCETDSIIGETGSSPASEDANLTLILEDSEEMEGRSRSVPPAMMPGSCLDSTVPVPQRFSKVLNHLIIHETFLVFPQHLRAPPHSRTV